MEQSSLALGAGVSAAFYAATATCFFVKDCHEKTLVEAMVPLAPQCWSQAEIGPDPSTRALNLYATAATPPNGAAQLCRSNTKGHRLDLQDIP